MTRAVTRDPRLSAVLRSQAQRRRDDAGPKVRREDGTLLPTTGWHDAVHGLSVEPLSGGGNRWRVTCDGCGHFAEGPRVALLVLSCGILFNPRRPDDPRRLCHSCAAEAWGADR